MKYLKYKIQKYIHQLFHKPQIYNTIALVVLGGNVEIKKGDLRKIEVRGIIKPDNGVIFYNWQDLNYKIKGDNVLNLFEDGWFRAMEVGETVIEVTSKIDPLLSAEFNVKVIECEK